MCVIRGECAFYASTTPPQTSLTQISFPPPPLNNYSEQVVFFFFLSLFIFFLFGFVFGFALLKNFAKASVSHALKNREYFTPFCCIGARIDSNCRTTHFYIL
mmetsp:Transcript_11233/g.42052  ORF Transcript_11233/g.42052 Transcript_11233/m.42052 type:complete len:102 (+) Transcript_11233:1592-1897(+)